MCNFKEQMEHFFQLHGKRPKTSAHWMSRRRNAAGAVPLLCRDDRMGSEYVLEIAEALPRLRSGSVSEGPVWATGLWASYSAQAPTTGKNSLTRNRSLRTSSTSTAEKNTSFTAAASEARGRGWMLSTVQERLDGWQRTGL